MAEKGFGIRMDNTGRCSSCGASIRWAKTIAGKSIPLDYEPDRNGVFVLLDVPRTQPRAFTARPEDDAAPHYTTHFATCPNAATHRRPK